MNTIYSVVKKYIDKMDYYALLAGGAPCDEFDFESKEISQRITKESTASEIADIIADVFSKSFDNQENASAFLRWAQLITSELNNYNI